MMFIRVTLDAFLSPNILMLKAPSSRELDRCIRTKNRPKVPTKCILHQNSKTLQRKFFCFFLLEYASIHWACHMALKASSSSSLSVGFRNDATAVSPGNETISVPGISLDGNQFFGGFFCLFVCLFFFNQFCYGFSEKGLDWDNFKNSTHWNITL